MPLPALPEGFELSLSCYLTSESTGLDTRVRLSGMKQFSLDNLHAEAFARTAELLAIADDFRPMTRDEIAEYKADEDQS